MGRPAPLTDWEALDVAQRFTWLSPRRSKEGVEGHSEPESEVSCGCSTVDTENGASPEDRAKAASSSATTLSPTRQTSQAPSETLGTPSKPSPRGTGAPLFLDLSRALAGAELGSPEMPTLGSLGHFLMKCKPCAFIFKSGCESGVECKFCHLCEPGEKKRRKKENKAIRRVACAFPLGS